MKVCVNTDACWYFPISCFRSLCPRILSCCGWAYGLNWVKNYQYQIPSFLSRNACLLYCKSSGKRSTSLCRSNATCTALSNKKLKCCLRSCRSENYKIQIPVAERNVMKLHKAGCTTAYLSTSAVHHWEIKFNSPKSQGKMLFHGGDNIQTMIC